MFDQWERLITMDTTIQLEKEKNLYRVMPYDHQDRYIDSVDCIEDFIQLAYNTLNFWKSIHTVPEHWANEWLMDDPLYVLKTCPVISNNYFTFDLKSAVLKEWCKENLENYSRCDNCGMISESGYEDCNCDYEEIDHDYESVELEDLIEWMEEISSGELPEYITESMVINAMEGEGFETYYDAVSGYFLGNLADVEDSIESIKKAQTNEELLQAVLWSTHVMHVNGNVLSDYSLSCGIDYSSESESIQQFGLESVFEEEEIQRFLEG